MEPRICVFKIAIVSADNVWTTSAGKEGYRAAIALRFPGQDETSVYQSDAVSPSLPAPDAAIAKTDDLVSINQNKTDATKADRAPIPSSNPAEASSAPVSFCLGAFSDYVRASDWLLWHQLVTDSLRVSLLWISPSSQTTTPVGMVTVDLSELLFSTNLSLERDIAIKPVIIGDQQVENKQPAATKNDAPQKMPSKGKKGNVAEEVAPSLCPNATMKVQITLDTPILSDDERDGGVVLEFSDFCVVRVPPQYGGISGSSATYSLAFEIPGFTGCWWSNLTIANQEAKQSLNVARFHGGTVSVAQVEANGPLSGGQCVAASLEAGGIPKEATANCSESDNCENVNVITWNASFRRFLPGVAVRELKEDIWKKKTWCGEIAKYSTSDQTSRSFERDHLSVNLNLSALLNEGTCETSVSSALQLYATNQAFLRDKSSQTDKELESNILTSAWEACSTQLSIRIKTSSPLQPVWVAPPKPQLTLEEILPMRPKLPTFADKLEIAFKEFEDLVQMGAQSIFSLQEKVISGQNTDSSTPNWTYRLEHKERMRQLLSNELIKSGTWHFLKQEMKQRVLKIAYEKFRLLNGPADGNYLSANKCYEEILSEEATNPDLWLQYGLFVMRETQKDHGKAEECFREAINLRADHAMSLLALASLMWHRSFLEQSEVLLNVIIDLHSQEEVIAWVLLGQVLLSSENRSMQAAVLFERKAFMQL
ncbi:hypothetical protein GOP47_0030158 [Adiantum capillus-veneris]|nr:hypothetical protein GOP47_0030158 [Adiantum capillus-veneris]